MYRLHVAVGSVLQHVPSIQAVIDEALVCNLTLH